MRVRVEEPYRVNGRISAEKVRVVGENVEVGIYDVDKAIELSKEQNLDSL